MTYSQAADVFSFLKKVYLVGLKGCKTDCCYFASYQMCLYFVLLLREHADTEGEVLHQTIHTALKSMAGVDSVS